MSQRKEIIYNIINSLLAGALVFMGSLTNGFSWEGLGLAFIAGGVVCITKFKDYWKSQEGEYKYNAIAKVLTFI